MLTQEHRRQVTLSRSNYHKQRLDLVAGGKGHLASAAENLLAEMERARMVADSQDLVRMGFRHSYSKARSKEIEATLVCPSAFQHEQSLVIPDEMP